MPQIGRLFDTTCAWWDAIEVLIVTGAANARSEGANALNEYIKRTGRTFWEKGIYRTAA